MNSSMPEPRTVFDWAIYRDATFAGLSVLIPVPLLDWAFESYFSRRMLGAIAQQRGRRLLPGVVAELQRGQGCMPTLLALPFKAVWELFKRILGKLLYFLAVKAAVDNLSRYWQRAFLIDYALAAGHLDRPASARRARKAMDRVVDRTASPLTQVARRVARIGVAAFPILRRARAGRDDPAMEDERAQMARDWGDFAAFLEALAVRYAAAYVSTAAQHDELPD